MATSKSNDKWTKEHFLECGFRWSAGEKFIYLGDAGYVKRDFLGIFDHVFWGQCKKSDPDGFFKVGEWYDFAVQTTSRGHFSTRRKKMLAAKTFQWWTEHPGKRSFLQVWDKVAGKKRYRIEELTMDDWHQFNSSPNSIVTKSQVDAFIESSGSNRVESSLGPIHKKALENQIDIKDVPF